MKILQIIPSYKPAFVYGGPIFSVSQLCEELVKSGHEVTVVTTNANGDTDLKVNTRIIHIVDGVSVHYFQRITRGHSNFSLLLFLFLLKNIRKHDAVHIHSWWNPIAVISLIICLFFKKRPILSIRGGLSEFTFQHSKSVIKSLFHQTIGKKILRYPILHVTTEKEAIEVKNALNNIYFTLHIIPNLVNLPKERLDTPKKALAPNSKLEFVSLARIHPVKNFELVIDTLGQIDFPFHFHIVGDGEAYYVSELKKRAKQRGLSKKITWHGKLLGTDKEEILRVANLKILMSKTENFGNAIIEALALGTPVLISKEVGAADYIIKNKLGWVIDSNQNEIVSTLNEIYSNTNILNEISARSSKIVRQDFTGKMLINKYSRLYSLLKR